MPLFHGLSAFPITPTDAHGVVKTDDLSVLIDRLVSARVDSIGLLGSTGGYMYLTRSERERAIHAAKEGAGDKVPLIVSVGALRTDEACHLAKDAEQAGAEGLLLAPVSYTPLTQEEVCQHFKTVAETTDLPLCIYNNPSTTHFSFGEELLKRLSHLTNIAAVKMPLPAEGERLNSVSNMRELVPDDFALGYSGDWGCAECMLAGAEGWYSVVGGLFPEQTLKLARAAQHSDRVEVERIDQAFQPLWSLFQEFGSYRIMYAAANLLNITQAYPHLPVQPLNDGQRESLISAVKQLEALV